VPCERSSSSRIITRPGLSYCDLALVLFSNRGNRGDSKGFEDVGGVGAKLGEVPAEALCGTGDSIGISTLLGVLEKVGFSGGGGLKDLLPTATRLMLMDAGLRGKPSRIADRSSSGSSTIETTMGLLAAKSIELCDGARW
jgi:hypothetical protein